jgi:hypothetical protein
MKDEMVSVRAAVPSLQPGGAYSGRVSDGRVALADHGHVWVRLPGTVGLFVCREEMCLWAAVCPGCLGSLDVALRAQAGIVGMALFWCPFHTEEVGT